MDRKRFSQTMASEWQTAFVVSHKMPWCALLTAVKNYNKSPGKTAILFLQDRDQDQDQMFKTKTKTFIFVLEAPRDQDPGLEDYITAFLHPFLSSSSCVLESRCPHIWPQISSPSIPLVALFICGLVVFIAELVW